MLGRSLQSAIVRASWGTSRKFRCKEILLSLLAPGHRIDPQQVQAYSCLAQWQVMLQRRQELLDVFVSMWPYICSRKRLGGPIGKVRKSLEALGWSWNSPLQVTTCNGEVLQPLDMTPRHWQHEVREAIRLLHMRTAASRRDDMQGIEAGVDRFATLALLKSKCLSDERKGMLRGILCGACWTGHRLASAGQLPSPICPFCDSDAVEDELHIWWQCPAWNHIREQHSIAMMSFGPQWPRCLSHCGLMPENMEGLTTDLIHEEMADSGDEVGAENAELGILAPE
eukprot:11916917-Karenia_brevis.AAC.1